MIFIFPLFAVTTILLQKIRVTTKLKFLLQFNLAPTFSDISNRYSTVFVVTDNYCVLYSSRDKKTLINIIRRFVFFVNSSFCLGPVCVQISSSVNIWERRTEIVGQSSRFVISMYRTLPTFGFVSKLNYSFHLLILVYVDRQWLGYDRKALLLNFLSRRLCFACFSTSKKRLVIK